MKLRVVMQPIPADEFPLPGQDYFFPAWGWGGQVTLCYREGTPAAVMVGALVHVLASVGELDPAEVPRALRAQAHARAAEVQG